MSVLEAFNVAVEQALEEKTLDSERHGAAIEAGRKVAAVMDSPEWPMVRGKIDNVSPSVFLKYCDALGILPSVDVSAEKPKKKAKLVAFTSSSKFAKAANE